MKIRIYDIENLPFGCQVQVKTLNGTMENAVVIVSAIAFKDGMIIDFEDIATMEVYLGWQ
jgi:hypothetical protein